MAGTVQPGSVGEMARGAGTMVGTASSSPSGDSTWLGTRCADFQPVIALASLRSMVGILPGLDQLEMQLA